ncbi:Thioesterase/thiol ester dehydrase-isomerase [Venturia nashicola]|uniref:Thioesterase/thiol ester dehydrase-isomerase n=1 Tax=Venturia nashicola TaxID=86259 RepID=A0A4Z1NS15_9PEZI|nr:Thioesterase/thiol ester dehydrase-isomerase [Venturia nashicola]TLD29562.1 Thioesterase/thiol ester dehydrase-isomerase [Venturia nashicola]
MSKPGRVPVPDPETPVTWAKQMSLEKVNETTFKSLTGTLFAVFVNRNGESRPRAFGGHVYAQAVYAASKTVPGDFIIHSVTGYFTLPGMADEPFVYKIGTIRRGRGYIVLSVTVTQDSDPDTICFASLCSFKRSEDFINVQPEIQPEKRWSTFLKGKKPEEMKIRTNWQSLLKPNHEPFIKTGFAGVYTTIFDYPQEQQQLAPLDRHNLYVFSTIGDDDSPPDPNLDACAHLYHSDRESIWSMFHQYELSDIVDVGSSLSHTVIFHAGAEKLRFKGDGGKRRWFYQETWCKRVGDGRGMHEGRIYDENGCHVASTMQDGAIKLKSIGPEGFRKKEKMILGKSGAKL